MIRMRTAILLGALLGGCNSSTGPLVNACSDNAVWGIHVTVVGGAFSGAQGGAGGEHMDGECAATVLAVEGVFSEELECSVSESDCTCWGVSERPGDYQVTATLGTQSETQTVRVRMEDECHVKQVRVTFFDE
jgi:hypothetical protein